MDSLLHLVVLVLSDLGMFCYWHVYFGVGENLIHFDVMVCVYLDFIHSDGLVVDVGLDLMMLVWIF